GYSVLNAIRILCWTERVGLSGPARADPLIPSLSGVGGGLRVLEVHLLAIHLHLHAADVLAPRFHLVGSQLEDAEVVEVDREEDGGLVAGEVLERAALLLVIGVVAVDDEVGVPVVELLRVGLVDRD